VALDAPKPKVTLTLDANQDLSRVWSAQQDFVGNGTASVHATLESGDLRAWHTAGSVALAGADARLPRLGGTVEGATGEIPFLAHLAFDETGFHYLRDLKVSPYAVLRFQDQHPLIRAKSFLSVRRLSTPQVTIAPLAGNVQLVQSVLSVSQLDVGVAEGEVTGQCFLDWSAEDTKVRADVRASGLRSHSGEPFDGNAAFVFSLTDHSIDGRAEILRIGREQLLALVDLQDPHRTAPAFNRVRQALALGYPDKVHIAFDHGFANAHIQFGGLARLVQLEELRGIPVEPLLDRYLTPSNPEDPEGT
jgi:hypothetical protein